MNTVLFQRLTQTARMPQKMSRGAAGFDLACDEVTDVTLKPGEMTMVKTGIAFAMPENFEGQIRGRSGLMRNKKVIVSHTGTLDSDYRGEVLISLLNIGSQTVTISPGDRIAQIVISQLPSIYMKESHDLPTSDRGRGGFGSTGI
jgi:dUTP pyrophosphatase